MAGIKYGGKGNTSEKDFLWEKSRMGTDVATPVVSNGKIYILGLNGTIWCIDILTGNELWQTVLPSGSGVFYSSPTLAGNKLYITSDEGVFFICEISSSGIKILDQMKFDDHFVATPVMVQERILLRGLMNLYCIGN